MRKNLLSLLLPALFFMNHEIQAQSYAEVGAAFGANAVSPVAAFHKNWELGKNKKIVIGTGLRYTGFFGKDINFTSAPNELAIEPSYVDTLQAETPALNSLNLMINLGYNLSDKIQVGFNIDALGFSFGPTGTPTFITNGVQSPAEASPTPLNVLLVGNNDIGSLNSHFYGRLMLTEKLGVKLSYQFLFNELTTSTEVQTSPKNNDRFRVKSNQLFVGLNYNI